MVLTQLHKSLMIKKWSQLHSNSPAQTGPRHGCFQADQEQFENCSQVLRSQSAVSSVESQGNWIEHWKIKEVEYWKLNIGR